MHHTGVCLDWLRKNIKKGHASGSPHTHKIWNPASPKCKQYGCPVKWHSLPTHVGIFFSYKFHLPKFMLPHELWRTSMIYVASWMTETVGSCEMMVHFFRTAWCHFPEQKFYVNHEDIKVSRHLCCLGSVNLIRVYFWQGKGLWYSNCNSAGSCINIVQVQFIQINKEETCVTYTWENKYTKL